jgi:hypothetical protein
MKVKQNAVPAPVEERTAPATHPAGRQAAAA